MSGLRIFSHLPDQRIWKLRLRRTSMAAQLFAPHPENMELTMMPGHIALPNGGG